MIWGSFPSSDIIDIFSESPLYPSSIFLVSSPFLIIFLFVKEKKKKSGFKNPISPFLSPCVSLPRPSVSQTHFSLLILSTLAPSPQTRTHTHILLQLTLPLN